MRISTVYFKNCETKPEVRISPDALNSNSQIMYNLLFDLPEARGYSQIM